MSSPDAAGAEKSGLENGQAENRWFSPAKRAWSALGVGTVAIALGFWTENAFVQGLLANVGVAALVSGLTVLQFLSFKQALRLLFLSLLFSAGVIVGAMLRQSDSPPEFPARAGVGTVADFTLGSGGPARNAFGLHFSMFSDSSWNLESKVWFARVSDQGSANGFLRLNYQLQPKDDHEPYVGVYTDFSLPPPSVLDISRFRRLTMRVRLGQPLNDSPIHLSAVLYSANVHDGEYIFPTFEVPDALLSQEWHTVAMPLDDFVNPSISGRMVFLDKRVVYRVAILIRGFPTQAAHGHIDIDDIQFQ